MPGNIFKYSHYFTKIMAEGGPSTSHDADVQSYYLKEPNMDIPPHQQTVVPIKGPVIQFMASHLELNYVAVSHHFQYFTGTLLTGALHCMFSRIEHL